MIKVTVERKTIDMESIIKETQKAREMVYQTMDMEEDKSNDSSAEVVTPRSGMVMVIDTMVYDDDNYRAAALALPRNHVNTRDTE